MIVTMWKNYVNGMEWKVQKLNDAPIEIWYLNSVEKECIVQ